MSINDHIPQSEVKTLTQAVQAGTADPIEIYARLQVMRDWHPDDRLPREMAFPTESEPQLFEGYGPASSSLYGALADACESKMAEIGVDRSAVAVAASNGSIEGIRYHEGVGTTFTLEVDGKPKLDDVKASQAWDEFAGAVREHPGKDVGVSVN